MIQSTWSAQALPLPLNCSPPRSSGQSTVASTPDLSPRGFRQARRSATGKRTGGRCLAPLVLLCILVALERFLWPTNSSGQQVDAEPRGANVGRDGSRGPLTVARIMTHFEETAAYIGSWHREGVTYLPNGPRNVSKNPGTYSVERVPASKSCNGVTEVVHIEEVFPDTEPRYMFDVLLSPKHGDWNPAKADEVLHKALIVDNQTDLPAALRSAEREGGTQGSLSPLADESDEHWGALAQVLSIPLPAAVRRLVGDRYALNWIVSRFSRAEQRGFFFSSSSQIDAIVEVAGVEPTQETCMSAVLFAPAGEGGTVIHWAMHIDANVPEWLRTTARHFIAKSIHQTITAMHEKAQAVQQSGVAPFMEGKW